MALTKVSKITYMIMAAFHSVGMKCRVLALPSENTCERKAASIIAPMRSGSRLSKLLFRKYCSFLCSLYRCYVTSLNLSRIASFKGAENCCSKSVLVYPTCSKLETWNIFWKTQPNGIFTTHKWLIYAQKAFLIFNYSVKFLQTIQPNLWESSGFSSTRQYFTVFTELQ